MCHDDYRVPGTELVHLRDEQLAGLVEVDVRHRRGLGCQQAGSPPLWPPRDPDA
jgi:hypothetical protein